jgi:YVTN family beta-propeller protein
MQQAAAKGRRHSLAILTTGFAAVLFTSGCGNQYRPVVTSTNPVGPAGQPTKLAVAISNPSLPAANPCDTPTTPLTGLITVVDVSGDTVLSTPNIGPTTNKNFILPPTGFNCPTNPNIFSLNIGGSQGYVIDPTVEDTSGNITYQGGGGFADFPVSTVNLLSQNVVQSTLATGANPTSVQAISVGGSSSGATATVFVSQAGSSTLPPSIAALNVATSGPSLVQTISIVDPSGVPETPTYVVGYDGAQRIYAISQNASGVGEITAIEGTDLSPDAPITIGNNPVYGVMTSDLKRAYIVNKGSSTVSVINVVNNALDTGVQVSGYPVGTIPLPADSNPVWADYSVVANELVVLNQGDGVTPGSLSIISIPLCNINAQSTNTTCNAANPVDGVGFGTVLATIPVGINPTMVSMLADGTQAYVANSGSTASGSEGTGASVSVVNLSSYQVTTIPIDSTDTVTTAVWGHPNTISATTGSPTGKVYVTSPDDKNLTIIRTDNNTIQTHIPLQGYGVRVMVNLRQ